MVGAFAASRSHGRPANASHASAGLLHQISLRGETAWGKHALFILSGLALIEEASSLWLRAPPLRQ